MKNFTLGLVFIFFIVLSVVDCQRWNSNGKITPGRKSSRSGIYYLDEVNGNKPPTESNIHLKISGHPVKQAVRSGIGAWGYISIILLVILSGIGIYYTVIFYPIVCKKQRMYHVMGSTTV